MAKNLHILISGPSGSGKTTLARYFIEKGENAVDGDKAIGMWIDARGSRVRPDYERLGKRINEWAEKRNLRWVCDEKKLEKLLRKNEGKELYIFGGPVPKDLKKFDRLYYLRIDGKRLLNRIAKRPKDKHSYHKHGATKHQRDLILAALAQNYKKAANKGYSMINASGSLNSIYCKIVRHG